MRTRLERRHRSRAQSLVEFALVTPLLLTLLIGVFEGARLIYAYNSVNHAAQEAGRVAILADTAGTGVVASAAVDAADPLTVSAGDVSVEVNDGATSFGDRELGDRLRVSVGYTFVPVTSLVFGSDAGIDLIGETEVMVE